MGPTETLREIEDLYREILSLTRQQEACLQQRNLEAVPSVLTRKAECLTRAQAKMAALQGASVDRENAIFQEGLRRLASVMSELVSIEDRCSTHAGPRPPAASRGRAAAAYSSSARPAR